MLTPTLTHLQLRTAQRIWFASWNAANLAARQAYEDRLQAIAERDRIADDEHERKRLRAARITPDTCHRNKHKLAAVGVTWDVRGYWRCRGCVNERNTAARRRRGISPQIKFTPEQDAILRRSYEAGQTVKHLAETENRSHCAIRSAILRAGSKIRTQAEVVELRKRTGRTR